LFDGSVARHYVYILECADGTLYTGYTTNPGRRVREHNAGSGSRYTRSRRPVKLAYVEELASRSKALKREIRIKKLGKKSKLLLTRRLQPLARHGSR
jgi:putative endonuclease